MDCADINDGDMIYFRDKLGITDERSGYLEIALQKIKEIDTGEIICPSCGGMGKIG